MLSQLSDDEIMNLLKAGNKQAFRVLFDRHSSSVYGYILCHCGGNRQLAEDILQEAWMRVLRSAGRYEAKGQFKAWLMTIARNVSFTQLGRQLKLHADPGEAEAALASDADIEMDFADRADTERVQAAIAALPDSQRVILTLWLGENLTYDEIAAATGQSEPSVRSLLFRAKKALKAKLEQD